MGVVQQDDDCWALYTAVFNEVVAVGRAEGISIPAEKAEARLARARIVTDGDVLIGCRSDGGQSSGAAVAGWASQRAWKETRRINAGERFYLGRVKAVPGWCCGSEVKPFVGCRNQLEMNGRRIPIIRPTSGGRGRSQCAACKTRRLAI